MKSLLNLTFVKYAFLQVGIMLFIGCKEADSQRAAPTAAVSSQFTEIPREQLVAEDPATAQLYKELQQRFVQDFDKLVAKINSMNAKPVFVFMTPEFATNETAINTKGRATIAAYCKSKGIEFNDFTAASTPLGKAIAGNPDLAITQMPKDGHWSALGAKLVADCMKTVVEKNDGYKSNYTHAGEQIKVMGPHEPNQNTVSDGGKDIPYRLVTNAQGFRNLKDIPAKSDKQRILFLGDSEMFFPFLDHEQTAIGILEQQYPNKEFVNAANWGFTLNDYIALSTKSASLAPDVVLVGLNGGDIIDYYFTHRARFSIEKKEYAPTPSEAAIYRKLFK
jgi:lysophospholipase L1-like esterase